MISRTLTGEYNFWWVEEVRGKGVEWFGGGGGGGESDITSINFEGNSIKASVNFNFGF